MTRWLSLRVVPAERERPWWDFWTASTCCPVEQKKHMSQYGKVIASGRGHPKELEAKRSHPMTKRLLFLAVLFLVSAWAFAATPVPAAPGPTPRAAAWLAVPAASAGAAASVLELPAW